MAASSRPPILPQVPGKPVSGLPLVYIFTILMTLFLRWHKIFPGTYNRVKYRDFGWGLMMLFGWKYRFFLDLFYKNIFKTTKVKFKSKYFSKIMMWKIII